VTPQLLAVHAVGVDPAGVEILGRCGAGVIWCPSSNDFLFGRTAPHELLSRVDVLLGSDSLLTGVGNLLDELRVARATGLVSDGPLIAGVGEVAARRLGLPRPTLAPGAPADLVLLEHPLPDVTAEDVSLVVVAGEPRVADERYAALFEWSGVPAERLGVGRATKLVASPLWAVARRVLEDWPDVGSTLNLTTTR
jgi:cytosine/adenosine deaminase-related metal-dependent hydrolase